MQFKENTAAPGTLILDKTGHCPFCSNTTPQTTSSSTLELENDSAKLRKSLLAYEKTTGCYKSTNKYMWTMLVSSTHAEIVRDSYKINDPQEQPSENQKIRIADNAHHIIPGNESLLPTRSLLMWMATNVKFTTRRYVEEEPTKTSQAYTLNNNYTGSKAVTIEKSKGKKNKKTTVLNVKNKKNITGRISWELNGYLNGIFLPGRGALIAKSPAETHAELAMNEARVSFHERHCTYSERVKGHLQELALALIEMHEICLKKCPQSLNKKAGTPTSAPETLTQSLNRLALLIEQKLTAPTFHTWYTSPIAQGYSPQWK